MTEEVKYTLKVWGQIATKEPGSHKMNQDRDNEFIWHDGGYVERRVRDPGPTWRIRVALWLVWLAAKVDPGGGWDL